MVGLLDNVNDWKIYADLPELHDKWSQCIFPICIAVVTVKVDVVIYQIKHKIAVVLELTSPIEENMEKRHQEKIDKYSQIQPNEGWSICVFAVEVGTKGWILRKYFTRTSKQIGICKRNKSIAECLKMARRCSYAIWVNRFNKDVRTFRYKSVDISSELIFHKLTTITTMLPSTPTTRITDI